jgi:carbamate kinase
MSRIVLALGGNAISRAGQRGTWTEARANMRQAVRPVAQLAAQGEEIVLTHGNGPQVGSLLRQQEIAGREVPPLPLDVLDAMSQGWIGYLIQTELTKELLRRKIPRAVLSWVTRVEVSPRDPAFRQPAKPIGQYYDDSQARLLRKEKGWTLVYDGARGGWRRVVPSPEPRRILEADALRGLLEDGWGQKCIFVVGGGGGVPMKPVRGGGWEGLEAVVDKDRTAAVLAGAIRASLLVIVTDVPGASVAFQTPRERRLGRVRAQEMESYLRRGEFGAGSMGPKVEAAIRFVRGGGRRAIITDIPSLERALQGEGGTIVEP